MKTIQSFSTKQPVVFVLSSVLAWTVIVLVFTGMAAAFGKAVIAAAGRLLATAGCLVLIWRLGWLKPSGVARLGNWPVWLIALAGLAYFSAASLFAFFGSLAFDLSSLVRLPAAREIVTTYFTVGLSEEILFRGLVLCALSLAWGSTRPGVLASVSLTSLLFACLHLTQIFTGGVSPSAALLLTLETFVISFWWGALVLFGGSIWPAVLLHFVGNALVALQGLTAAMLEPELLVYQRHLWFSLLPGLLGVGLLALTLRRRGS